MPSAIKKLNAHFVEPDAESLDNQSYQDESQVSQTETDASTWYIANIVIILLMKYFII